MPETQSDPIIDELRAVRDEHAGRFNYDVEAIFPGHPGPAGGFGARVRPLAAAPCSCRPEGPAKAVTCVDGFEDPEDSVGSLASSNPAGMTRQAAPR